MLTFSGQVTDSENGAGVPSATVEAWVGNLLLMRTATDRGGYFSVSTNATPDTVKISSIGYGSLSYPFNPMFSNPSMDTMVSLQRDVKTEDNVTVTSTKKNKTLLWIALGVLGLVVLSNKKR